MLHPVGGSPFTGSNRFACFATITSTLCEFPTSCSWVSTVIVEKLKVAPGKLDTDNPEGREVFTSKLVFARYDGPVCCKALNNPSLIPSDVQYFQDVYETACYNFRLHNQILCDICAAAAVGNCAILF